MELLYCIIPILLGWLISKMYAPLNKKIKVIVSILLPVVLNLCVSLLVGLSANTPLGYGHNVGNTSGLLVPATLIMMITLVFCIKSKNDVIKNEQKEDCDMSMESNQTKEEIDTVDIVNDNKVKAKKQSMLSCSIDSLEWWKKLIVLILIIIAFLFALNGRYSCPVEGYILDKWTGSVHEIDSWLVDN